jgi:hypothetical protein
MHAVTVRGLAALHVAAQVPVIDAHFGQGAPYSHITPSSLRKKSWLSSAFGEVKTAFECARAWGMPRAYLSSVLNFVVRSSSAVC